jgi:hypothetical protein
MTDTGDAADRPRPSIDYVEQCYHNEAERIVETILEEIAETLAQGGRG